MTIHNLAVIGAGSRSRIAKHALREPGRATIIAVADPDTEARARFQKEFALDDNACFSTHDQLLASALKLDGVFITTPPNSHTEIACACLEARVPVFLEKPMAASIEGAAAIIKVVADTGTRIQVGFNCRYAPFFTRLKEIIDSGQLGRILSMEWKEILDPHHWSTYCRRPSYSKRDVIGSWLLEKCCHDIDLMNWLIGAQCVRVASFGSRSHFNARTDVPARCTDGCPVEQTCMYSAFRHHPELRTDPDKLPKFHALCVYNTDSDLVDHQSTILEYADGATAVFSLLPLIQKHRSSRFVHICGTEATSIADWTQNEIRLFPHESKEEIVCDPDLSSAADHGAADPKTISAFLAYLDDRANMPKSTLEEGWESMVVACGIATSLREQRVVELDALRRNCDGIAHGHAAISSLLGIIRNSA